MPGSSAAYLKRQLEEFRAGARQGQASLLMNASAKHLSDDEMTAATDYFSKLKVVPWTRVVEFRQRAENVVARQSTPPIAGRRH